MQACFDHLRLFSIAVLLAAPAASLAAAAAETKTPDHTDGTAYVAPVRSVVRVDAHSGRLVRTVIVPKRPVSAFVNSPLSANDITTAALPVKQVDAALVQIVDQAAKQYDVDPLLVHSVIEAESNYNQYATSPKGAQGLMQLIPSTAKRFGASNTYDAKENVEAGVRYLKYLNTLYPNDLKLTLAAYNAGEGAVAKHRNSVPPYPETEQYVEKVGRRYGTARRAADQTKAATTPVPVAAAAPKYRPIEEFMDADGRLHLRTKPEEASSTP